MTREAASIIMIAIALLGLGLMLWGWRRRQRRDSGIAVPLSAPTGEHVRMFHGLYVATTRSGAPLDRIAAKPLGFRSRADVEVTTEGVAIAMPGQPTVFLAASRLTGAGHATWTVDRVVEPGGLVLIAWTDGANEFDTYLRLTDDEPASLIEAVSDLAADTPTGATR